MLSTRPLSQRTRDSPRRSPLPRNRYQQPRLRLVQPSRFQSAVTGKTRQGSESQLLGKQRPSVVLAEVGGLEGSLVSSLCSPTAHTRIIKFLYQGRCSVDARNGKPTRPPSAKWHRKKKSSLDARSEGQSGHPAEDGGGNVHDQKGNEGAASCSSCSQSPHDKKDWKDTHVGPVLPERAP